MSAMDMEGLITWFRAQLDDDERVARAAIPGPWEAKWWGVRTAYDFDRPGYIHHGERVGIANNSGTVGNREAEIDNAEHIARWDPARVLAEVEAKRRILDLHAPVIDGTQSSWAWFEGSESKSSRIVKLLVQPYADRPGWRPEWRMEAWSA